MSCIMKRLIRGQAALFKYLFILLAFILVALETIFSLEAQAEDKTVTHKEVVVKPKKEKYSKKNNPAVELMRQVRKDHKVCDPMLMPLYSYEKYEKILLGSFDMNLDFSGGSKSKSKFSFLEQYVDTALWTGKKMLDLALLEKSSLRIVSSEPKADKEIVRGLNSQGINEILNGENVRKSLSDVLREIDIYENDITLMQNKFVSPLSRIGADFYKYSITDTVYFGGDYCIELSFVPKVPETFGFNGKLYIPRDDSIKYVKRVSMRVPKAINVNYVDNIFVSQNFEKDSLGKVHKVLDDLCLEIKIFNFMPSLYASRQIRYHDFEYAPKEGYEETLTSLGHLIVEDEADKRTSEFWQEKRIIPFSHAESKLADLTNQLRKIGLIKWGEKILKPVFQGYVGTLPIGSKFNIGPVNTFISYNDIEGLRLKSGGYSTSSLSDRIFFRGYVAYGLKDKKWKYEGELEYSFIKKKEHSREFPINAIRAAYKFDTDQIGVRYLHTNPDNVILSLRRKKNDLIAYRRTAQLEYILELANNLSFDVGYKHEEEQGTDKVRFRNSLGEEAGKYRLGAFFFTLRYAPGEQFVQSPSKRMPVNMDAPIFTIKQEYGPKRLLGADFVLNQTEISVAKRLWLSAFGYVNILLKTGKIWSQVPYPALLWQNANLSYTIQQESFALLNPMEFAMDQYASWDFEYFMNGALFNRVPLLKKTKLREVLTFKGFFGSLTKKNNPDYNPNLYIFPSGNQIGKMGSTPYMEFSVGLDNIFTILRVDYVWRVTYRNEPDISKNGIRVSLHLSF